MSRRRSKARRADAVLIAILVAVDLMLASVLWDENGAGPVVLAGVIVTILVLFSGSRKRSRRR